MSYILQTPYTDEQRADFIVLHNHTNGLRIEETETALFALELNEMMQDGESVVNPDYEEEQRQKERQRIALLNLTAADVERGIYQAIGKDFDDIVEMVTVLQPDGLDIKALKIELKANYFYRGNPYVNKVGELLGFTAEQLDRFFETNDYKELIPIVDK